MIGLIFFSIVPITCGLLHNIIIDKSVQFYNPVYKPTHIIYPKDFLGILGAGSPPCTSYWSHQIQKAPQLELLEVTTLLVKYEIQIFLGAHNKAAFSVLAHLLIAFQYLLRTGQGTLN